MLCSLCITITTTIPNMKLSQKTLTILKNFASIKPTLMIKEGKSINTLSTSENILAEAQIEEYIPRDVAIYELGKFLSSLDLYSDPDIDFTSDRYMTISEGPNKLKYFYADPKLVPYNELTVVLPDEYIKFTLNPKVLDKLVKASYVCKLPDVSVVGKDGQVKILVRNKKDTNTSNEYCVILGETDLDFAANFKVEHLGRLLSSSYEVKLSKYTISEFTSSEYNIRYAISLEPDSYFN